MSAHQSLAVLVESSPLVCAIPTASVSRLLLDEDVVVVTPSDDPERPARLRVGNEHWLGFELGALLETDASRGAWVLLSLSLGGNALPIALRTGRCLAVREVPAGVALPGHLFRSRPRALRAAFPLTGLGVSSSAVCGARLDPEGLLEGEPIRNAIAALDERSRGE